MLGKNIAYFVLGAALAAGGLYGLSVGNLVTFTPNTPIKSSEVNTNFSTLKSAIEVLETLKQNRITATCGEGSSIRVINADGTVVCEPDDVGSGGSSYNADGSSLELTGTTFSIKTGGVTLSKLANNSVNAAKVVDEPGVVFTVNNSGGTLGAFDTAPTEMLAITINAPANGFVLIIGTVSLELKHTNGSPTTAYTNISTVNTSFAVGTAQIDSVPSTAPTGSYWHTVTVQTRLSVVAGNNTFYFMGARGPSNAVDYARVRLSATFFPTSY